jgi:Ferritin-like
MSADELKLLPRNATARRAAGISSTVAGNSVSSLLESGVGNCFPGLECDIRNLERRFFPFLEVDFDEGMTNIRLAAVDVASANTANEAGTLDAVQLGNLIKLANIPRNWRVVRIEGDFGPLGPMQFDVGGTNVSFGQDRLPVDAWTAVRMLKQGSQVTLNLQHETSGEQVTLTNLRQAYFDPDGALAEFFEPGELTQSLCSPWTHDFRDCGCYYWASNHPDIAMPPPLPGQASFARGDLDTDWQRSDRTLDNPVIATGVSAASMAHHEISDRWQELNFVLEGREQITPYRAAKHVAAPLADTQTLVSFLRYAAGVELTLTLEYLSATWSLRRSAGQPAPLSGDLQASAASLLDVAVGEMRHLRAVNDVLREVQGSQYVPALQVASQIPIGQGQFRDFVFRPLTSAVIAEFVEIEAPSQSVDGLYSRILATLELDEDLKVASETIRTIMAEGETHWQTFRNMSEWLGRHSEATYLRATNPAPADHPAQQALQTLFEQLLNQLHVGYSKGRISGAVDVNAAKATMLSGTGIRSALEQIADAAFVPVFTVPPDPRFTPIGVPDGL